MAASGFYILLLFAMSCCAAPNPEKDHCEKPDQIKGAQLQGEWHDETYPPGKVANFVCLPEYTQDGPIKMACIEGTWWQIAKGQCKGKKCDRPDIKHGIIYNDYYYPREVGRYLEYYCESSYQPRRWTRIYCTNAGWEPEPKCSRECTYRDASFENAQLIDLKSVYVEGDKVQFRCTNNYQTPDGKDYGERTCLPNGKFTPAKCSVTCMAPQLQNGKFNQIKNQYEIGEFLQYECNKGYMTKSRHLSGKSQCLEGRWNEAPQCIPITCQYNRRSFNDGDTIEYRCPSGQKPRSDIGQCYYYGWGPPLVCEDIECTIPESSNLVPSPFAHSYKINMKVSFSCKGRFIRSGSLESVCTEGGWNPLLPTCKDIECTIPESSNLVPSPFAHSYKINMKVSFSCKESFVRSGSLESVCTEGGWNPLLPTCKEKRQKCPIAYSPQNAEIIDPKEVYYSNDIVTMICARGYKMHGSPKVQCVEGKWEQPPECTRAIQCQNPPKIENGIIESANQEIYATDDVVKYSCRSGFHISGSDQSTCVNGHWSALPTCTEDACVEAPNIQHGTAIENKKTFSHGERAKYECDNGFRFKDEDVASCVEGQWMNIPVCISTSCKSPPKVLNSKPKGGTKSSYASGEKITYECNSGYSLERSGEAQCDNTIWINIPVCRRTGAQCGPPPTVQYGDTVEIRKAIYRSGEKVEFRCPEYYILDGNRFVTCLNGVWNEAPVCIEPCTAKERDMESNNIQLKWRPDRKFYSRHGETIEFICKPGYEALPDTQMRITCNEGNLEYPKCFKRGFCVLQQSTMTANNIHYNLSTVVDHGQKILFQCNDGMMAENNLEAKCEQKKINYPRCTAAKSSV
ncbi:coagulation factor XIII B chain-like isoform X2 [Bufo gargarizans]|uniref:coagulation factor XIII B chain-like isoform X2 n=1 Tax=Bufo gargarizans TaxID=30331 RepID=UPI001CF43A24|nr:coagulation factor XIII B chain-like isoform X2 [Bufo gargarizans]